MIGQSIVYPTACWRLYEIIIKNDDAIKYVRNKDSNKIMFLYSRNGVYQRNEPINQRNESIMLTV